MTDTSSIWTGEAARYDRARPAPPSILPDLFSQLIQTPQPTLVVDLGSGTGLSTMLWEGRAHKVLGIEPNADMRAQAIQKAHQKVSIEFQEGFAHQTGLPDNCADIVTCSQSFHWMEPTTTLAEIARILRPGGLFAAYDYDWPPVFNWEVERVYQEVDARFKALLEERGLVQKLPQWSKLRHLERIRASSYFRFSRELLLHHVEQGDAARFLEIILTNTYSHQFKLQTITEQEIGFDRLKQAALQHIGSRSIPWYFGYHVRIGIK